MRDFFLAVAAIFAVLPLFGQETDTQTAALSGEVRIADTIGGEEIARRIAMGWGRVAPDVKITIQTISLLEATERGDFDVILYRVDPRSEYELEPGGEKSLYAVEAAYVYAHEKNPRNSMNITELSDIFCGDADTWVDISGERYSIRRYAVTPPTAGEAAFRELVMGQLEFTENLQRTVSAAETAANCGGSEYSIGVAGFLAELPENVKLMSVEEVAPSFENIALGKYPLTLHRVASQESKNELGKLFIAYLSGEQVRAILPEFDLPPIAAAQESSAEETNEQNIAK